MIALGLPVGFGLALLLIWFVFRKGGYKRRPLDAPPGPDWRFTGERFLDEHFRSRDAYVPIDHPVLGNEFIYGDPWKAEKAQASVWKRVPLLGEDTEEILTNILGLSESEVARLKEKGVLQ